MADETDTKPTVENRWWAEIGKSKEGPSVTRDRPPLAGDQFYRIAEGYDQDHARDALTDLNLRLLHAANPPEGSWSVVQMLATCFPERELERIKRVVDLPPYARGAVIDCGRTIRLLVTGTPIGERLLELALVDKPSFDCWVKGEWVREELYRSTDKALGHFRTLIREYLSPEAVAAYDEIRAQA